MLALLYATTNKLLAMVGDPQQLEPTVISRNEKDDKKQPLNPFAQQLARSLMGRLVFEGFETFMLPKQRRQTVTLSDLHNNMSYHRNLEDEDVCELSLRPESQQAIEFIKDKFHDPGDSPQLFLGKSMFLVSLSTHQFCPLRRVTANWRMF